MYDVLRERCVRDQAQNTRQFDYESPKLTAGRIFAVTEVEQTKRHTEAVRVIFVLPKSPRQIKFVIRSFLSLIASFSSFHLTFPQSGPPAEHEMHAQARVYVLYI